MLLSPGNGVQRQHGTVRGVLGAIRVPSTQVTPTPACLGGVKPIQIDASQTLRCISVRISTELLLLLQ